MTTTRSERGATTVWRAAAGRLLAGRTRLPRQAVLACADLLAWPVAILAALLLRTDFDLAETHPWAVAGTSGLAAVLYGASAWWSGLWSGRCASGSFESMAALTTTVLRATAALFVLDLVLSRPVPASVPLGAGFLVLVLVAGLRYVQRLAIEAALRPSQDSPHRLLVVGAGAGAEQVLTALLRTPESPYLPVALLDDDPHKARLRLRGIPVVGTRDDLESALTTYSVDTVLVAIPSAAPALLRDVASRAEPLGAAVKVLPPVVDLLGAPVRVSDIRPVTDLDLLGRRPVDVDLDRKADYLSGRRVLVTGAGGSIGSELCRQLAQHGPAELYMLDRDESALHAVKLSLDGSGTLDSPDLVVADIRDARRLDHLFATLRPDVVFHAAALKHLPLLERHPGEAWKTNVLGTRNVLEAALRHDVQRLVNISTDKAADPVSVLGYSKRLGERLTASAGASSGRAFLSVRFGNVLGSRGSVLTTFRSQIASGGPVTVTHPEVLRYFMTVQEAVRLVLIAGSFGSPGQALVLDMGEPVRIADVARRLIAASDRDVQIEFTGLREGEKLREVRLSSDEPDERPLHPLICHVPVPLLPPSAVEVPDLDLDDDALVLERMRGLCGESIDLDAPDGWRPTASVPAQGRADAPSVRF